jgi:DNA modification methylase
MKIEQLPTADLIPYARNTRTHSPEQVAQIAGSIREFGFTNPVLIDAENGIIAGHGRVMAASKLGLDKVPCIRLAHLTETQKRAYIIADNKLALNAGWDEEMLALELGELGELDFDLSLIGFDESELGDLMAETTEGATDPDDVPEPPVDPVTVLGDVWIMGKHRLMCGDSTSIDAVKRLMAGARADMMFTDPPYGVDYSGGIQFQKDGTVTTGNREKLKNDDTTAIYTDFLPVALSVVDGPCYMWFADSKARDVYNAVHDNQGEVHALIIWHKTNATYAAMNAQYKQRHEPCLYFKPKGSTLRWCGSSTEATVWSEERDGVNEFHPTQKPVKLAAKAIGNHKAETVLDMFCGSGSTVIAAEQTGRKCFAIELNPAYVDVAVKRWQDFAGKQAIHEASGKTFDEMKAAKP